MNQDVRKAAVECLIRILQRGVKADMAVEQAGRYFQPRERAFLYELVYGVLRRRYSLEADFSRFCKSKPDEISASALLLGAYQLRHMRVPTHAAVSETVAGIKQLNPKAAGFVNAILRRVADSEAPLKLKPNQRAELPKWMYAAWRDAFGADIVHRFCETLKQPPALCVAVFVMRDIWIDQVRAMGIEATAGALSPYAVLLPSGTAVTSLPGFDDGAFTVMDQAAQATVVAMAAALEMKKSPGMIVDVCAAPGGKTALLSHRFPDARIIAVELNGSRILRLQENMSRLQRDNVSVMQADALYLPFVSGAVETVFLDAPCSASGILRRHPDAKFLHDAADVEALSAIQRRMVHESLRVLKPDGNLMYVVCSIHPQENEQVLIGLDGVSGVQRLFPGPDHDGFFHASVKAR
ncbi:MAG: transcription antitermination factor NusB [Mariprofundus sp.]|nr:transcription antitermination factor NusB [Mariprofundus sp.]